MEPDSKAESLGSKVSDGVTVAEARGVAAQFASCNMKTFYKERNELLYKRLWSSRPTS